MNFTKFPDSMVYHGTHETFFGKNPKTLLLMDLDDTLMKKTEVPQFKYDINKLVASEYKLVIVTNQMHYKPGNKKFNEINNKIIKLSVLECNYEVYIGSGSKYYYRKPSPFIAEKIIESIAAEEGKRLLAAFPENKELINEIISNGQAESEVNIKDPFLYSKIYLNRFLYEKIFPYENIIFVGDQAGRKVDYGTDDINFSRNFNIIMPYLEAKHKYDLPRVEFMSPEAFFLKKQDCNLYDNPEFHPYEFFNYYIQNPEEYTKRTLPAKAEQPEILYICGFSCSGKSTLAEYISKKWGYTLINREPIDEEFKKELLAGQLKKSYVLDLNTATFKYVILHHTRALVIKTDLPFAARVCLVRHLRLAKIYNTIKRKKKGCFEITHGNKLSEKSLTELEKEIALELNHKYDGSVPQFTVKYFPTELLLSSTAEEKEIKMRRFKFPSYYRMYFMLYQ